MTSPRWARLLLRLVAPSHRKDDLVGDLEESHLRRVGRRGATLAWLLSSIEALDLAVMVLLDRMRRGGTEPRRPREASRSDLVSGLGVSWLDFKLGLRAHDSLNFAPRPLFLSARPSVPSPPSSRQVSAT